MKSYLTAITALAIGIITATATAAVADGLPPGGSLKDAPAAPTCGTSTYNWNGAFAGVQLGTSNYRSSVGITDILGIGGQREDQGLTIGGVIGYNFQKCNTVFGVEAEFNWVDNEKNWGLNLGPISLLNAKSSMDSYGALKLRSGFAFDNLLLYLTGGLAFANIEHTATSPAIGGVIPAGLLSFNNSDTRWGWVVGAGTEFALTNRITWRSEATYTRFEDQNFTLNANVPGGGPILNFNAMDEVWRITTGINLKF